MFSKLRNQHWYIAVLSRLYLGFKWPLPSPGCNPGYHAAFSHHVSLVSFGLGQFLNLFLFAHVLYNFEEYWLCILYDVSQFGFVWCFLLIRLVLRVWDRNTIQVKCLSHLIISDTHVTSLVICNLDYMVTKVTLLSLLS